jgi:hypothetical protein
MSRTHAVSSHRMTVEERVSCIVMIATMMFANLLVFVYIAPSA